LLVDGKDHKWIRTTIPLIHASETREQPSP
jgi:hypothetical protein